MIEPKQFPMEQLVYFGVCSCGEETDSYREPGEIPARCQECDNSNLRITYDWA